MRKRAAIHALHCLLVAFRTGGVRLPEWLHGGAGRSVPPLRRASRSAGSSALRGHAVVEVALVSPWIFFLFVGAFDMGFYTYSLTAVQSAARVAAMYTSSSAGTAGDSAAACTYALGELNQLINVGTSMTTCSSSGPVNVVATALTGVSGVPLGVDGQLASNVSVTYQSPTLIPIPGILAKQLTVTRSVQMRVRK